MLSRDRVAFAVRNVDEDASAYDALVALGYRSVPVTVISGRAIKGYDEPALRAARAASSES